MYTDNPKQHLIATRNLSRYPTRISNSVMNMETSWCRMVYSDFENMLAPNLWHAVYEFHYVIRGEIDFTVEGEKLTLREGEFLVVPPKVLHSTERVEQGTQKIVLGCAIESKSLYMDSALEEFGHIRIRRGGEHLRELISLMMEYAYYALPLSEEAIQALGELLLFEFARLSLPAGEEQSLKVKVFESDRRINECRVFIRENIESNIRPEQVAEYLHLCVRHLNRLAKEQTGSTVGELINREKLLYIKRLLRSEMPLETVAQMTGFSSEYTLNRFFKRHEGMSLGAWRRSAEK